MLVSDIFKIFGNGTVFDIVFKNVFELRHVYKGELQFAPVYTMNYRILEARVTYDGTIIIICE